jgi:hypothetical protein
LNPAFTKFMGTKTAGCASCLDLPGISLVTESTVDEGLNRVLWCGSPGGAFLND